MKKKSYNFGIFSWFGYVQPLPERLDIIKRAGFDSTIIWWEDETFPKTIKKEYMPYMVRDMGLNLENIHVPYSKSNLLWSEVAYKRENILKKYFSWVEDCAKYNIPMMVMHINEEEYVPEFNKYGLDSIKRISQMANEAGIKIALENTKGVSTLYRLLEEIPLSNLGICYDSSHDNIYSKKPIDILDRLGNRLFCTHLSDNDGYKDMHLLPGYGEINWDNISKKLKEINYKGNLTLEVTCRNKGISPIDFLQNAYEKLNKINNMMK
ncbi:sugar phosphate isomerase/epimerase family protein [Clostridiisalibacter paucivorans]|uniref:sugar phosphate isomerase/epimerase family protein n=1 Tax=Clostridiisalibacter paucivorans TaxID=408753 RepID=UPI00047B0EF6|nr:sugar phosphate isomerase/epimerase [Clostridiisalibacter paucivorans]